MGSEQCSREIFCLAVEGWQQPVLVGRNDGSMIEAPVNAEAWVVEADSRVVLRRIVIGHLVAEHRIGLEGEKAVGEADWNEDLIAFLGSQQNRDMLAKGG